VRCLDPDAERRGDPFGSVGSPACFELQPRPAPSRRPRWTGWRRHACSRRQGPDSEWEL